MEQVLVEVAIYSAVSAGSLRVCGSSLVLALFWSSALSFAQNPNTRDAPDSCPVTRRTRPPFVPPAPHPAKPKSVSGLLVIRCVRSGDVRSSSEVVIFSRWPRSAAPYSLDESDCKKRSNPGVVAGLAIRGAESGHSFGWKTQLWATVSSAAVDVLLTC